MLRLASNDVLTLVLFPPPAPLPTARTARFRSDSLLVAARLKRRCYSTAVPAAHPAHPLRRSRLQCFIVFLVSCPPLAFYSSAVAPFAPSSLLAFAMVSRSANVLTLAPFPPPPPLAGRFRNARHPSCSRAAPYHLVPARLYINSIPSHCFPLVAARL